MNIPKTTNKCNCISFGFGLRNLRIGPNSYCKPTTGWHCKSLQFYNFTIVQTRMLYTRLCKGDSTILCTYNTKSTIVCNSKKKFTIELIKTFLLPLNKKVRVSFNFIDCSHLKCFKLCKTSFLLLFSWFFFKFHSCLLDQLVNLAIYCSFDLNIVFLWRKDMNVFN